MTSTPVRPRDGISRRGLLAALPIGGIAVACSADDPLLGDQTVGAAVPVAAAAIAGSDPADSILPTLTPLDQLPAADGAELHVTYAPAVPPPITRADARVINVDLEVLETVCPLDPANGVTTLMWRYRIAGDTDVACGTPGPTIRGRVGDVMRVTMTNLTGNMHPHNIEFHAVTGQGVGAADLTAGPGESKTIEARLPYPGAFMYHCAFGDVPEHIAKGMYGMVIVDPEEPLPPVDHEWGIVQSGWYVGEPDDAGVAEFDRDALFAEEPRYVTFNGRTDALDGDNSLRMQVGGRARIYFVNEGLNLVSNFHPIGSHWDVVGPEAAIHPANRVIRGSQSTLVAAGGGTVVELVGQVPSTLILVDHALVRTFYKGAIGKVVVEGPENPEIFSVGQSDVGTAPVAPPAAADPTGAEAVETNEVTMPVSAWDPANAATAYTPPVIVVDAGTIVTWRNEDSVVHTITSGRSDGNVGTPDGRFDSGNIERPDTFTVTFTEPGEYDYYCLPHPWMRGRVIVR
ncbi:MAG: plastocyanin/azurin family copper-binding protein [Acidimicrobiales bacterium]|nr:plastocyanin/azurin family copper-binding protein [Acidimicrobiales bacterium]